MIDSFVKVVDALTKLIGALAWPLIAAVCLFWFGSSIRSFLGSVGEISVDFFGLKASGKTKAELGAALASASAAKDLKIQPSAPAPVPATIEKSFNDAEEITSTLNLRSIRSKGVLWVDDQPNNNKYEVQALRTIGLRVYQVTSTTQVMNVIKRQVTKFDVIISNMARPEGARAGYDLLKMLKSEGVTKPFIIYSSTNTPEQAQEARKQGAFGSTTEPDELVRLVIEALPSSGS